MATINAIRLQVNQPSEASDNFIIENLGDVSCNYEIKDNGSGKLIFTINITSGMEVKENLTTGELENEPEGKCVFMLKKDIAQKEIVIAKEDIFLLFKPNLIDAEIGLKFRIGAQKNGTGFKTGGSGGGPQGDNKLFEDNIF